VTKATVDFFKNYMLNIKDESTQPLYDQFASQCILQASGNKFSSRQTYIMMCESVLLAENKVAHMYTEFEN